MDYLDTSLAGSILSALASNLASSSDHDDLALLTAAFSPLEPVSTSLLNGVLSRITPNALSSTDRSEPEVVLTNIAGQTAQQAESVIGFAEYSAQSQSSSKNLNRTLGLLRRVPAWEIEPTLGTQTSQDCAPIDQVTYALVSSVLSQTQNGAGDRASTLNTLAEVQQALVDQIPVAPGHRVIGHLLPALNGCKRALTASSFRWSPNDPSPVSLLVDKPLDPSIKAISSALNQEWDVGTSDGRVVLATLQQYLAASKGLWPGLVPLVIVAEEITFVCAVATDGEKGWKELVGEPETEVRSETAFEGRIGEALGLFKTTLKTLLDEDLGEFDVDPYAFDLLLLSLTLATLYSLVSGSLNPELVSTLESLVSEYSPVTDELVQTRAIEALQLLVHAFPMLVPQATRLLLRFILSPSAVFERTGEQSASPTLIAAAKAYSQCIQLSHIPDGKFSAIQSLFNSFSLPLLDGAERMEGLGEGNEGRTEGQIDKVSINIAHAAARFALEFGDLQSQKLASAMLLQRLTGSHPGIDGAIMYELAELAEVVDVDTFSDIAKGLSAMSRAPGSSDAMSKAILGAQTRLAVAAARRKDLKKPFVVELLSLFVDKGMADGAKGAARAERTQALLDLVPVLDAFFSAADLDSHRKVDQTEIALFRSTWYLFVLSGFLSTAARIADWQRAALVRIATATPCLLANASHDFLETDLEYDSVFKKKSHVLSGETLRSELATAVPQQSGVIRTLSTPETVFLSAVLRLESMRAEAGYPSNMLSYFQVEGVGASPTFNALASIADRVNATFIAHFSERVVLHSIDASVFEEVRLILLQCCHQFAKVRFVAIRYLNDLIASFPSLVCDASVVTVLLEILTVLRRACQSEFHDEYTPVYTFPSLRGGFTLTLPDDYTVRNSILDEVYQHARAWLKTAVTRAPLEMQGLLQDYIDGTSAAAAAHSADDTEMGKSVAIDFVRMLPSTDKAASLPPWGAWKADNSSQFARTFSLRNFFSGDASNPAVVSECAELLSDHRKSKAPVKLADLRNLMYRTAAYLIKSPKPDLGVLHNLVELPFRIFSEQTIAIGLEVWTWVVDDRPELEVALAVEVTEHWLVTIQKRQGLFSATCNQQNPLDQETQYTPTDKEAMMRDYAAATRLLQPHTLLLTFISSRFQAFRYRSKDLVLACILLVFRSVQACATWSTHQLARELRMRLVSFGFCILQGSRLETAVETVFRSALYDAALSWFALRPGWSYGSNRIQLKSDLQALEELQSVVVGDNPTYSLFVTSLEGDRKAANLPGGHNLSSVKAQHGHLNHLLCSLLENEIDRLRLWINPLMDPSRGPIPGTRLSTSESSLRQLVRIAWSCSPAVAVHIPERFKFPVVTAEVTRLVRNEPGRVQDCADALQFFIGDSVTPEVRKQLRFLIYWAPVPVISALRFVFPKFGGDPILLQYALRVLEHHPVEVTFFYVPQVVQALRTDALGYAERFIFETSKISQLFCHQIIWNMKANAYRGDDGEEADPMKPTLDRMIEMIVESLSGDAQEFFQREFSFFDEVTSISAKLKPFIKSSKLEKKAKIDEEMAKIKVDPGVYLPSNPDGVVVDIDRHSGRPLQSHAKAPFMATFKVHREQKPLKTSGQQAQNALISLEESTEAAADVAGFDTWQSAIFKVGDDCRQDMLALQIIAMHKNIFTCLGLDLLVTPYRVTATDPGCGVIDVIPNATSRDEMGRAKVNDLRSFFIIKYGSPDGVHFQKARINFIQSMAAYSLLCYIVQIKDRHNGNIMIDGHGCITHVDFGFLFDIDEFCIRLVEGVKFEPNSFKFSHEMVVLMGGRASVGFRMFSELTVKAFLACRPFGQAVVDTTALMLAAEFPSFKGEPTIQRLKDRFRLDLSEKDAAEYMKGVIANACENPRSGVYDEFQRITNGIPYAR